MNSLAKSTLHNKSSRVTRGVFINTAKAQCSIYESGRMVFSCLNNHSDYEIDYFSLDEIDIPYLSSKGQLKLLNKVRSQVHENYGRIDFWVFNWHPITMAPIISAESIKRLPGKKFTIILEVEPNNPTEHVPANTFDGYLVLDPTVTLTKTIFPFPRPLEGKFIRPDASIRNIPVIGSFGFGTPGKGFELLVDAVNREFDEAVVRINVPAGTYADDSMFYVHRKNYAEHLASSCKKIAKPGVEVKFTYDFMEPGELVQWCTDNDLNCFMYTRRQSGLSATTDQAIMSGRPLLVSSNDTFRHIHRYIPPYPITSLREAIKSTTPAVHRMQDDWSRESFGHSFRRMLAAFGLIHPRTGMTEDGSGSLVPQESSNPLIMVVFPSEIHAQDIFQYSTRLSDSLGRTKKYEIVRAPCDTVQQLSSAAVSFDPAAVILCGATSIGKNASIVRALKRVAGTKVFLTDCKERVDDSMEWGQAFPDVRVIPRKPIIPYYTSNVGLPDGPPCIWLIGFTADGSNLEEIVAKIQREQFASNIFLYTSHWKSDDQKENFDRRFNELQDRIASTPEITLTLKELTPAAWKIVFDFSQASLIVFYNDPELSSDIENLRDLALTTERPVVFTHRARFPQYQEDGIYIEDFSIPELLDMGVVANIKLCNKFSEGRLYAEIDGILCESPNKVFAGLIGKYWSFVRNLILTYRYLKEYKRATKLTAPIQLTSTELFAANTAEELLALHDEAFIHCTYATLLGRNPDPEGFNYYLNRLRNGETRRAILAQVFLSAEGRRRGCKLPGLYKNIRRYRWLKLPVIGVLLHLLGFHKERFDVHRKLRVVENQVNHLVNLLATRQAAISIATKNIPNAGNKRAARYCPPLTKDDKPIIYYYVDHTIVCASNSGVQRVTRYLGRELLELGEFVCFIKWDEEDRKFCLVNRDELANLCKWNGPVLSPESEGIYPIAGEAPVYLNNSSVTPLSWLLIPEVTYITYHPCPVTVDVIMTAKRMNLRIAFIYYDTIRLCLKEYADTAAKHEAYMQALLLADAIIPISSLPADELVSFFVQHQKATSLPIIEAIHLPGEVHNSKRQLQPITHLREKRTILCVGSIEPLNNHLNLIDAFNRFTALPVGKEWKLILAENMHNDMTSTVAAAIMSNPQIEYMPALSDDELFALYRTASFTVFPSILEGFSMPILESLWHGLPCVCTNFGVMAKEAAGGGCLTVDIRNSEEILSAFFRLSNGFMLDYLSRQAVHRPITGWHDYARSVRGLLTYAADESRSLKAVYYLIDTIALSPSNTAVAFFVRHLANSLITSGITVIPVYWNTEQGRLNPVSKAELSKLTEKHGPTTADWGKWQEPGTESAPDWLLLPCALRVSMYNDIRTFSKDAGMRCAAILHETIDYAYTVDEVGKDEFAGDHRRIMEELAAYDKVFAVTDRCFQKFYHFLLSWRGRVHSAEDRFKTVRIPNEVVGQPRRTGIRHRNPSAINILIILPANRPVDLNVLLDAVVKILKRATHKITFTMIGQPHRHFLIQTQQLRENIKAIPGVLWEEGIDGDTIHLLYKEADIIVFPELEGCDTLSVTESQWNALPSVVHKGSAVPTNADLPGVIGANMRDSEDLASVIIRLAEDERWYNNLATEARTSKLRTWADYAREITLQLATDRLSDSMQGVVPPPKTDIYEKLINLRERPKLSICISTYNRAGWLAINLQNMFAQIPESRDDLEFLVVDNTSTDHTPEVVAPYLNRRDFRYVRNPTNEGMLGNLTVTAQQARGEYFWILGDDDLVKQGTIASILDAINKYPNIAMVYLNYGYSTETDPANVGEDINEFLESQHTLEPACPDEYAMIKNIATKTENIFSAIYSQVFRRDHGMRAYCQNTSGRVFSSLLTCIPTTYYVLHYMADEFAYWIGKPSIVVNSNVSWVDYASLFELEQFPRAHDLAERMGANPEEVDKRRAKRLRIIDLYWKKIFENDKMNNYKFFSPSRALMRIKHLKEFDQYMPHFREIYDRAYSAGHPAATKPTAELFCAFNEEDDSNAEIS